MVKLIVDEKNSQHTRFRIFAGKQEGSLGLCGSLIMRNEEFIEFMQGFDECFAGEDIEEKVLIK